MPDILSPDVRNLKMGGAIIALQREGTTGYIDLGNIPDFALGLTATYVDHKGTRSGRLQVDRRMLTETGLQFKIGQEEFNAAALAIILNANQPGALTQASGTLVALTVTNPTIGAWYELGAYRVSAVVVKGGVAGTTAMVEGTDYSVEYDLGLVRALPGGAMLSTDTMAVTFTKPALTGQVVVPFSSSGLVKGAGLIYFRAEDGSLWKWNPHRMSLSYSGDIGFTASNPGKASGVVTIEPDYTQAQPYGKMDIVPLTT